MDTYRRFANGWHTRSQIQSLISCEEFCTDKQTHHRGLPGLQTWPVGLFVPTGSPGQRQHQSRPQRSASRSLMDPGEASNRPQIGQAKEKTTTTTESKL